MEIKKIIIVDDHALFASALSKLINSFPDYEVSNIFANGEELTEKLASGLPLPNLILLDVKMPIMDGIATMKWLKKFQPNACVLALSMENNDQTILKMIKYGARGYLLKDTDPKTLFRALKTIEKEGYYYSELVNKTILNSMNPPTDNEGIALKDTELEFLKLACEEKTYQEIADIMHKSIKTIDGYRKNLFIKLGVKNRIGLVIYAIKNHIYKL